MTKHREFSVTEHDKARVRRIQIIHVRHKGNTRHHEWSLVRLRRHFDGAVIRQVTQLHRSIGSFILKLFGPKEFLLRHRAHHDGITRDL